MADHPEADTRAMKKEDAEHTQLAPIGLGADGLLESVTLRDLSVAASGA